MGFDKSEGNVDGALTKLCLFIIKPDLTHKKLLNKKQRKKKTLTT